MPLRIAVAKMKIWAPLTYVSYLKAERIIIRIETNGWEQNLPPGRDLESVEWDLYDLG
jgi:hypothetical protein